MLIIIRECLLCFHFLFRPEKSKCTLPEERLSMGRAFHSILLESVPSSGILDSGYFSRHSLSLFMKTSAVLYLKCVLSFLPRVAHM